MVLTRIAIADEVQLQLPLSLAQRELQPRLQIRLDRDLLNCVQVLGDWVTDHEPPRHHLAVREVRGVGDLVVRV